LVARRSDDRDNKEPYTHLPRVASRPPCVRRALTIFHHKFPMIQRHLVMEQGGHGIHDALAKADSVEDITLQWIVRDPPEVWLALPWSRQTADLREYRDLVRTMRSLIRSHSHVWYRQSSLYMRAHNCDEKFVYA
jgi:hypothetical protein